MSKATLEGLGVDQTNTVVEVYELVADYANTAINGITETMRGNVLRVHSVRRGYFMDLQRTTVRVGGVRHAPITQQHLLTRWAKLGTGHLDGPKGALVYTETVAAGSASLVQWYPGHPVEAGGHDRSGHRVNETFTLDRVLEDLEPERMAVLLGAAQTVVSHVAALEQINEGVDPADALAALRNPSELSLMRGGA